MKVTQETRQLSFADIKPKTLTKYMQILEIIGNDKMTAREIEKEMNTKGYSKYFDMNHVRPRLTELTQYNELAVCGTKIDNLTKKSVAVYRKLAEEEKKKIEENYNYVVD